MKLKLTTNDESGSGRENFKLVCRQYFERLNEPYDKYRDIILPYNMHSSSLRPFRVTAGSAPFTVIPLLSG
jgi:hypothetical protein